MNDVTLLAKVQKVRLRTINPDLLDICDVLEGVLGMSVPERTVYVRKESPWRDPETGKFDKRTYQRAYMREYMRKYRKSANPFEGA